MPLRAFPTSILDFHPGGELAPLYHGIFADRLPASLAFQTAEKRE